MVGDLLGMTAAVAASTALCALAPGYAGNGVGRVNGVAAEVGLARRKTAESVLTPFFEVRVSEILLVDIPA